MNPEIHGAAHERVDHLTRVLRFCGTLVLLGAASAFMFGKWEGLSDVTKYGFLLAHTVMLFSAGIVAGARVKDSRTGRTFMLLTLGAVPVNFAITGGLLHSQFALDEGTKLPQAITWLAPTPLIALLVAVGSAGLLTLLSLLSTRGLVRAQANQATLALIGISSAMWVPLREPSHVALVLLLAGGAWLYTETRVWTKASCMRTLEGRLVRVALALPVALMIGRTLAFYGGGGIFGGVVLMLAGLAAFLLLGLQHQWQRERELLDLMAACLAALGWLPMALELHARTGAELTPLWVIPCAALLFCFSLARTPAKLPLRTFAVDLATLASLATLPIAFDLSSSFTAVGIGVLVLAYAIWESQRILALLAGASALIGLACTVVLAVRIEAMLNWTALSVLGVLLIFGATLVEKRRTWFVRRVLVTQRDSRLQHEWHPASSLPTERARSAYDVDAANAPEPRPAAPATLATPDPLLS